MLQLSQCKLLWQEDSFSKLQKKAAKLLGISVEDFTQFMIVKRSLDARKKPNLFVLYTVKFSCRRESEVLKRNRKNKNLTIAKKEHKSFERTITITAGNQKVNVKVRFKAAVNVPEGTFIERDE